MVSLCKAIYILDVEGVNSILQSGINIYNFDWEKSPAIKSLFEALSFYIPLYDNVEAKGTEWLGVINLTKARNILIKLIEFNIPIPLLYKYDIKNFSSRPTTIIMNCRKKYEELENDIRKNLSQSLIHIKPLIDIILSYYR